MRVFRKNQLNKYQNKFESKSSILGKIIAVCLLTLVPLISPSAVQADGFEDLSFGEDGIVTTVLVGFSGEVLVGFSGEAASVAMQSDGKIVVAGVAYTDTGNSFAVVRYNTDGTLDGDFGIGGIVLTRIGDDSSANSVVLQSDGKIVVAGYSYNGTNDDFAVVRYNTDGSLDGDFGIGGIVTTDIGGFDIANSVVVQSDGKIVVVGYTNSEDTGDDFVVIRYNTDGTLDTGVDITSETSFGIGGIVTTDFYLGNDYAKSVAMQSDDKIVVAGSSAKGFPPDDDFALVRYNTDGTLDTGVDITPETSFGIDGIVTTDIDEGNNYANSVVVQSDGKIVAAGVAYNETDADFAVIRYDIDGTLDGDFGVGGIVTKPIGSEDDYGRSVVVQVDGKIVVVGSSEVGVDEDFVGVRFNNDGSVDGEIRTNVSLLGDTASSVVLQPDGKIVVAGSAADESGNIFAVVRYSITAEDDTPPSGGDSDSSSPKTDATTTPAVVKTAAGVFNLKNKTYLSKNDIKTKLSKNKSFKRNPEDLYKYSIFKASKKACIMRGNYVMGLKKNGACEMWVTRTTAKGEKYKYWIKINYTK